MISFGVSVLYVCAGLLGLCIVAVVGVWVLAGIYNGLTAWLDSLFTPRQWRMVWLGTLSSLVAGEVVYAALLLTHSPVVR